MNDDPLPFPPDDADEVQEGNEATLMEDDKNDPLPSTHVDGQLKQENRPSFETAQWSKEERTPTKLKCMEPDLVVEIQGVEFYHYKSILAAACPFFDNALSSGMKEAQENKISFTDQNADLWLTVYELFDLNPMRDPKPALISIMDPLDINDVDAFEKMMDLLSWFDFLGLDNLCGTLDEVLFRKACLNFGNKKWDSHDNLYEHYWQKCKLLLCPTLKITLMGRVKFCIDHFLLGLRFRFNMANDGRFLMGFFLDEECGEEVFEYLLTRIAFPDAMIENMGREEIVNNPMFLYFLEACSIN